MNEEFWKIHAVYSDTEIKGFRGPYKWLSNFQSCPVYFEGLLYPSSENAYQSAKVWPHDRTPFRTCTPVESKNLWKSDESWLYDDSREQWDARKYDVMSVVLFDKFYRNIVLRKKLVETGNKYLEELNYWSDIFWGVDIKKGGENNLGKILMKIREYWRTEPIKNISVDEYDNEFWPIEMCDPPTFKGKYE